MLVNSSETFYEACGILRGSSHLAIDLETTGLDRFGEDDMCGVAVYNGCHSYYFPYRHAQGYNLPLYTLPMLWLSLKGKVWKMHNAPFDISMMVKDGCPYPSYCKELQETQVAIHLLNENEPSLRLKDLGDKYNLGAGSLEEKILFDKLAVMGYKGKKAKGEMWRLPASDVAPYAEMDVILTWELANFAEGHLLARDTSSLPHVDYSNQFGLWAEWNVYQSQLSQMEMRGILLDVEATEIALEKATLEADQLEDELVTLAGRAINIRSYPQLCAWFELESTAKDQLESIPQDNPMYEVGQKLLSYRGWSRAKKNYYQTFLDARDPNNVVHTSFNITGTVTPRISSRAPNLQNLARTGDIYNVRQLLIARPGCFMLSSDLSMAELRIAAHFAQEQVMIDAILNGVDIHQLTADMLGVTRKVGKECNFSLMYRIGAEAFMRKAKLSSVQEAKEVTLAFRKAYPAIDEFHFTAMEVAEKRKTIRWFSGRERHYNDRVKAPYRHAMANLVQGTVGDIIRIAINRMWEPLKALDCHIVLQVHDDVKVEVKQENLDLAAPIIVEAMTDFDWLTCPMKADVNYGYNLGEMEPYVA